jgi:hypothetical protein
MIRTSVQDAYDVFQKEIYPDGMTSVMCSIHDAFGGLDETPHHNCLGCTFADTTGWIYSSLDRMRTVEWISLDELYFDYLLKLYLVAERMNVVFDIINLPEEYKGRHFSVLQNVTKWANFIKHPKFFLLVHHPSFFMESDPEPDELKPFDPKRFTTVVDQKFVKDYYSGDAKNAKLEQLVKNKADVAVIFPNLVELTADFCRCIHKFVGVIRDNEVYREVLHSRATFENYFNRQTQQLNLN